MRQRVAQLEQQVGHARDFVHTILDTIPDPIFVKDEHHRWILLNQAFCRFMGHPREELLGKSDHDFFPKQEADVFWAFDDQLYATGKTNENEESFTDGCGEAHVISTKKAVCWDPAGKKILAGVIRDITARVRGEEALKRAHEQLTLVDAMKTELFTNVSHDLRTPLTLILGPLEDVLAGALDATQRQALETVRRNARQLQKLVSSLLDFARLDAGRANVRFEPTDLARVTRDVASFFDSAARSAGLDFVVDCAPLDEPAWVDRDMWEKIVSNLLSNALKFTLKGSIRVRLRAEGEMFRLEVEDTGAGIPEAELPRLFERFHRVAGTRARSQEGSGIGLALVSSLARQHGGAVSARSTEGVGTTFTVSIPRGHAHLPADRVSMVEAAAAPPKSASADAIDAASWITEVPDVAEPAAPAGEASAEARPRVIIADDNADMRAYLGRMLRESYEVEAYADGKQALDAIRRRLPDVVVTDVMMPVMSGLELLVALRADEQTRALPIVMVSARAGAEARVEGIEAGADDYLVKPFSARELLARVRTQWALAQMRREAARHAERVARMEGERRWLEAVLDRTPMPLLLIEPETGRMTFANRAADAMAGGTVRLGVSRDAYLHHDRVTDAQDHELPLDQWPAVRAARGEKVESQMIVWHTPAGRFPLLASAETLPATSDHPAAVVLAFQDVSELVRAIRARDEFLSIASHELKTPLTSLRLQVQFRERALAAGNASIFAPESLARMMSSDVRQVDRLTRLVDDILDVSRISSGRFALAMGEPIDLAASVRDVLDRSSAALAAAGCQVTLDAPAPVLGRWDRGRIEQVVLNLLTNAWKYGHHKPIHLAVRSREDRAELTIRDEGIGIAAADQKRVFEIFERAVSKDEVSGLGLGLYITRRIVEAHGGSIRVESEIGRGATFTVELPIEASARATVELPVRA